MDQSSNHQKLTATAPGFRSRNVRYQKLWKHRQSDAEQQSHPESTKAEDSIGHPVHRGCTRRKVESRTVEEEIGEAEQHCRTYGGDPEKSANMHLFACTIARNLLFYPIVMTNLSSAPESHTITPGRWHAEKVLATYVIHVHSP